MTITQAAKKAFALLGTGAFVEQMPGNKVVGWESDHHRVVYGNAKTWDESFKQVDRVLAKPKKETT